MTHLEQKLFEQISRLEGTMEELKTRYHKS